MFGGTGCPARREPVHGLASCNEHKCASFTEGTICHEKHVHCKVKPLPLPGSEKHKQWTSLRPACVPAIPDEDECWETSGACGDKANSMLRDCHDPDTEPEKQFARQMKKEHAACTAKHGATAQQCRNQYKTIVVTHDRKYSATAGGAFHCHRNGAGACVCTCDRHPPCCTHQNKLVSGGEALRGNKFSNIATLQDCCNLCTNHPHCTAWEYGVYGAAGAEERSCVLKQGAVSFIAASAGLTASGMTVWSGLPSSAGPC